MSSPLQLALAELDNSVRTVESQFDRLDACLTVDEYRLVQALQSAFQLAMVLSKLVDAERPGAQWTDRAALEKLIQELEAAAEARANQQRRDRFLELANELDAGHVKHRVESRSSTLNEWRSLAVDELRAQAALPQQTKELPGPDARHWLSWAFGLQDERDAEILVYLAEEFPVLEHFTGEMDERYWVPGRPLEQAMSQPSAGAELDNHAPAELIANPASNATPVGDYAEVLSRSYERPAMPMFASEARRQTGTVTQPEASPAKAPGVPSLVEAKPSASLLSGAPVAQTEEPRTASQPAAETPSLSSAGIAGEPSTEIPDDETVSHKRSILVWTGATGFIVLSALFFAIIYRMHAPAGSKPTPTAEAATINSPANVPTPETPVESAAAVVTTKQNPEAAPTETKGPLLHKQPVEGPQDNILISLENCDRGNPGDIECWGYVSNLGGASSRVSLDRIDVVGGRNSVSLDRKGQFALATGQSSNLAPGSRVKFTVKVPDKDLGARTLTLYVDLSNPRSLEYTFYNVPVAE